MPYKINSRSSDAPVPKCFTLRKKLNTVKVLFFVDINVRGIVKNYKFVEFVCVLKKKFADFIFST
jgi:hypothetical protein